MNQQDRTFAASKLFFTFATGGNLLFPWSVGASVVLMQDSPREAEKPLDAIARHRPTVFFSSPTGYAIMMAHPSFAHYDLSSLRLCVSAGEALPASVWQEWHEKTGIPLLDGIGSTENYHMFIANRVHDIKPGSSGKVIDGYEARIVDEQGQDLPCGEVGNLWIKGPTAALSYLNSSVRSRRIFRGDWLATGDKYRMDEDGYYWHEGRSDDMLKVGGIWVSPVEVESVLMGHPAVLDCAVVGWKDSAGLVKPKAFVVAKNSSSNLSNELSEHCRLHLAGFKRPRVFEFVEDLPRTATGKVQRFRLSTAPFSKAPTAAAE